jgi:hypothetical protein
MTTGNNGRSTFVRPQPETAASPFWLAFFWAPFTPGYAAGKCNLAHRRGFRYRPSGHSTLCPVTASTQENSPWAWPVSVRTGTSTEPFCQPLLAYPIPRIRRLHGDPEPRRLGVAAPEGYGRRRDHRASSSHCSAAQLRLGRARRAQQPAMPAHIWAEFVSAKHPYSLS